MNDNDLQHLRAAFALARQAHQQGSDPFGALLVDAHSHVLLSAVNTVITDRDCTGHAETNLARMASARFSAAVLATCTLYASAEPCAMCAGAIHWSNIGRVVYGLSSAALYAIVGASPRRLHLPCHEVFARSEQQIEVIGPLLEEEARMVYVALLAGPSEACSTV